MKKEANSCVCSKIVIIMPNTLCQGEGHGLGEEYLYRCTFNNNSAILTLQL